MSMAQITGAGEAMAACAATFNGKKAEIDLAVNAAKAEYGALAANLRAVVVDQMDVSITYDPAAPAASLIDGGIFRNWNELCGFIGNQARGARIQAILPAGSVLEATNDLGVGAGFIHLAFTCAVNNPAPRPKLRLASYANAESSSWANIAVGDGGSLKIIDVDVEMAVKSNPALPASTTNALMHVAYNNNCDIALINSVVKGVAETNIIQLTSGGLARISLRNVTIDGPTTFLYRYNSQGVAILSTSVVSLSNGATLHSNDFTLGSNLLRN